MFSTSSLLTHSSLPPHTSTVFIGVLSVSIQAFVQLGTPQDAKMMVKYYTMNPLTIKGRKIRLNICAKYKTLE